MLDTICTCVGIDIDPLGFFGEVCPWVLFDQRWSNVLLLTQLLLVHDWTCLLLVALAESSLRQVASQIDLHGCFFHDRLSFISRYIVLYWVLQCLSLSLNTGLHLFSKLLIDFEVLYLQFAVALLLCIDQLCRHTELKVWSRLHAQTAAKHVLIGAIAGKVRNAFVQIFAQTGRLLLLVVLCICLVRQLSLGIKSLVM